MSDGSRVTDLFVAFAPNQVRRFRDPERRRGKIADRNIPTIPSLVRGRSMLSNRVIGPAT